MTINELAKAEKCCIKFRWADMYLWGRNWVQGWQSKVITLLSHHYNQEPYTTMEKTKSKIILLPEIFFLKEYYA